MLVGCVGTTSERPIFGKPRILSLFGETMEDFHDRQHNPTRIGFPSGTDKHIHAGSIPYIYTWSWTAYMYGREVMSHASDGHACDVCRLVPSLF